MKAKELIIAEIETLSDNQFTNFKIGYREASQSLIILPKNNINVLYAENCELILEARFIVKYFLAKGMKLDDFFSKQNSRGIYVIKNKN